MLALDINGVRPYPNSSILVVVVPLDRLVEEALYELAGVTRLGTVLGCFGHALTGPARPGYDAVTDMAALGIEGCAELMPIGGVGNGGATELVGVLGASRDKLVAGPIRLKNCIN
jgi:hypothetical protein